MDPKNNRKSYSDLEAIVTTSDDASSRHQSYWNAKFLAAPSDPDPKLVDVKDEKKDLKEAILGVSPVDQIPPPPPAYYLVDAQGQTRALYAAPTNTPSDATSIVNFKTDGVTASGPGGWWKSLGEGKRLFGMRKNIFLAVLAGVCVLIFGLLATILAVTRAGAGRNGNPPPPAFSTKELLGKGDSGPLLAASDLAAMNWTDTATGIAYSGVFYQSSSTTGSALMVAFKNEKTQTWGTVNISASAAKGTLDVLPGTPLAAASNNGLWNLLYLTSQGTIAEVYAEKPTSATGWQQGSFAEVFGRPIAMPGSGLGAMWQRCGGTNCDNALFVTWQNSESGALVYANMTNLTWGSPITLSTTAAPGTPAAVSAFTDTGPTVKTGADHTAVRWYYASGSGLTELLRGPVGKFKVVAGNFGKCFAHKPRQRRST